MCVRVDAVTLNCFCHRVIVLFQVCTVSLNHIKAVSCSAAAIFAEGEFN